MTGEIVEPKYLKIERRILAKKLEVIKKDIQPSILSIDSDSFYELQANSEDFRNSNNFQPGKGLKIYGLKISVLREAESPTIIVSGTERKI